MRQLRQEGRMHNRARMIVASFLTKDLYLEYVRRYLPELEAIGGKAVHEPWRLDSPQRRHLDYPLPIVDHYAAAAAFIARRT
jgi:deoxyribodipyrimidine photolyase